MKKLLLSGIVMLAVLPACCCRKKECCPVRQEEVVVKTITEKRVSGPVSDPKIQWSKEDLGTVTK